MKRSNLNKVKRLISKKIGVGVAKIKLDTEFLSKFPTNQETTAKNARRNFIFRRSNINSISKNTIETKEKISIRSTKKVMIEEISSNSQYYTVLPIKSKKEVVNRKNPNTSKAVKRTWISKIRKLRQVLKQNKKGLSDYRSIYLKIKGNYFKNTKALLNYIKISSKK
jgi:ribosomal protein L19E